MKQCSLISVVLIFSTMTGCLWKKKPKVVQMPPAVQRPSPSARPAPTKTPARAPVAKVPVEKRAASETAPAQPAKQASTQPAAILGQMLSPAERAQLAQAVDRSLSSARRSLAILSTRTLTTEQAEQRKTIEIFIAQAEQARQKDLTTAAQLARRAEVLAQSLAGVDR
jgi:hypothetical protein